MSFISDLADHLRDFVLSMFSLLSLYIQILTDQFFVSCLWCSYVSEYFKLYNLIFFQYQNSAVMRTTCKPTLKLTILILHGVAEHDDSFQAVITKKLSFGKGELLEGHAWSCDDEIFAVAGCKICLCKVSM